MSGAPGIKGMEQFKELLVDLFGESEDDASSDDLLNDITVPHAQVLTWQDAWVLAGLGLAGDRILGRVGVRVGVRTGAGSGLGSGSGLGVGILFGIGLQMLTGLCLFLCAAGGRAGGLADAEGWFARPECNQLVMAALPLACGFPLLPPAADAHTLWRSRG
eukprot:jgi/Mesen1/7850/ME000042S07292